MIDPQLTQTICDNVAYALAEDIGTGDVTAALIAPATQGKAYVFAREPAVLCGNRWFEEAFIQVFNQTRQPIHIKWLQTEGTYLEVNQPFVQIEGYAQGLLTAERTALNFLQLMSGTATRTKKFVDAVQGTNTQIVDSRKTIPGLRIAQKYAVKVGGGTNHRIGLYDAILIKDNHIATAGSVTHALNATKAMATNLKFIQIEVETLAQLEEALNWGAQMILLDNMDHETIAKAVSLNNHRAILEVSGGVSLDNVRSYAELGVDRISIGGLTKHVQATDYSMSIDLLT